jgi:hypothetical protein
MVTGGAKNWKRIEGEGIARTTKETGTWNVDGSRDVFLLSLEF